MTIASSSIFSSARAATWCAVAFLSGLALATPALALDPDLNRDGLISRAEVIEAIQIYHMWKDRDRDGVISLRDLVGASPGQVDPGSVRRAVHFIRFFDYDGSGTVSAWEMLEYLRQSRLFEIIDSNRDGYLSPSETRKLRR